MARASSARVQALEEDLRLKAQEGLVRTTTRALATSQRAHERTVRAALRELEEHGVVETTSTKGSDGRVAGLVIRLTGGRYDAPQKPAGRPLDARAFVPVHSFSTAALLKTVTNGCSETKSSRCDTPSRSTGTQQRPLDARWTPAGETNPIQGLLERAVTALEKIVVLLSDKPIQAEREATSTPKATPTTSVPLASHPANSRAPIQPRPAAASDEGKSWTVARDLALRSGRTEQEAEAFAFQVASRDHGQARRALHAILERKKAHESGKGKPVKDPVRLFHWLCNHEAGLEAGNWEAYENEQAERPKAPTTTSSRPTSLEPTLVRELVKQAVKPVAPEQTPEERARSERRHQGYLRRMGRA